MTLPKPTLAPSASPSSPAASISRRAALRGAAATAAAAAALTIVPRHVLGGPGQVPPSEKITLGSIGLGGQGTQDLESALQFPEVQVVAVCDVGRVVEGCISWNWTKGGERRPCGREPARKMVDDYYAEHKPAGQYRGCRAYSDYRELLAKEDVDGVIIATPDHTHAVITMAALKKKKHVYCEKPLTYSVYEARQVAAAAKEAGVATQLGNQGQATEEARLICEWIAAGAIGPVREVEVWSPARFWGPATWDGRPSETPPVPEGLDWDLWLGPAPQRPYHPAYTPWNWRNWWDFGTGLLGDLGCHKCSTVFKALKLTHPTSVDACSTRDNGENYPMGVIARYQFPERGPDLPPLTLNWYDGGLRPPQPKDLEPGRRIASEPVYIGDKGTLMGHYLVPDSKMKAFVRPPKSLPRSPGHMNEWVNACRGGPPAGSNFVDHAGLLTEFCMLGNVALRAGKPIAWDGPNCKVTNDAAANKLLHREYRAGWTL